MCDHDKVKFLNKRRSIRQLVRSELWTGGRTGNLGGVVAGGVARRSGYSRRGFRRAAAGNDRLDGKEAAVSGHRIRDHFVFLRRT